MKINTPEIAEQFNSYPEQVRDKLLALRELILTTASELDEVGEIKETLKWGQLSYLTTKPKTGTTIRIDQVKGEEGKCALYVHCQTTLIEDYKEIYKDTFKYQGNRAILFDIKDKLPKRELKHCISMALRYHLNKK